MIEGLKLKVTSSELRNHCTLRAVYHRQRADEKQMELPRLREALEAIKATGKASSNISNMSKGNYHLDADDPVKDLENDIRDHRQKALVFDFFAGHLFDEDYTLQEADLTRLEILKR